MTEPIIHTTLIDHNPFAHDVITKSIMHVSSQWKHEFVRVVLFDLEDMSGRTVMSYLVQCNAKARERLEMGPSPSTIMYEMLKNGLDRVRYAQTIRYLGALWDLHPNLFSDTMMARMVCTALCNGTDREIRASMMPMAYFTAHQLNRLGIAPKDAVSEMQSRQWMPAEIYNFSALHSGIQRACAKRRAPWKEVVSPMVTDADGKVFREAPHPWYAVAVVPFLGTFRYLSFPDEPTMMTVNMQRVAQMAPGPPPAETYPIGFKSFGDENLDRGYLLVNYLVKSQILQWWCPHRQDHHSTIYLLRLPR